MKELKKVMSMDPSEDEKSLQRFKQEHEIMKQIDHPYILKTVDYFEEGDSHHIVMDYASGGELYKLIQ
jgi:serine/threonine protein kinase